ncbi:TIGR01621 family pseudouridine synthase [Pseudocolwellia agarivorans]|uniref:TIGR01621 family pseudouridine synthase n=1 Tax=Pseudocolwellia agarivorans TaxID=1911682 RepID=UPI0009841BC3|nr:TIGR01621 family pseudouridine synthase [Pseudocolwellia agarivorans]
MSSSSIRIIDEQSNFIVVNKPANTNFHDEGEIGSGFFNEVKQSLKSTSELYPVHRLDKMTSGLLIFAKNSETAKAFQQLFEQHHIQKYYLALSDKKPKKKQGLIKGDMAKSRRSAWKLLRSQENPAISQFMSFSIGNGIRLYLVKPHSGKTHQIRVALSSIGSPIIGDAVYGGSNATDNPMFDRGYLHAYALQFTLNNIQYEYIQAPSSGELFLSAEFSEQLKQIELPWLLPWPKV